MWKILHRFDTRILIATAIVVAAVALAGYETDRRSCDRQKPVRAFQMKVGRHLGMHGAPRQLDCSKFPPEH